MTTANVVDLGTLGRSQTQQIPAVVLLATVPQPGEPAQMVTAQALVDAIMSGVRAIIKDELAQIVNEG